MAIIIRSNGQQPLQDRYRSSVENILNAIRRTNVGRVVIRNIELASHDVIINPLLKSGANNSFAMAMNASSAGSFTSDRIASGTGARVWFSVERSTVRHGNLTEVLLHELAHSLRFITGTTRLARQNGEIVVLPMVANFHNVEEFFAITVTNILSSELGRPLRGDHRNSGFRLRNPEIYNVAPFSTRMRQFIERMPQFTNAMAQIPEIIAPFNPFREQLDRTRFSSEN